MWNDQRNLETIKSRRSCRAYKPEQITDEELNAVLEAGTYAASAMGRQSAKIVVVQDAPPAPSSPA
ncbi:MAG: nitroreductase family protein [Faecalibacterium prausnitzii]